MQSQKGILHLGVTAVVLIALVLSGAYLFYLSFTGGLSFDSSARSWSMLCVGEGRSCSSFKCCDGLTCSPSKVCTKLSIGSMPACADEGESCEEAACCEGLSCSADKKCEEEKTQIIGCSLKGFPCEKSTDCCTGYACGSDKLCYGTLEDCTAGQSRCSGPIEGGFEKCVNGKWQFDRDRDVCECSCINGANGVPYCEECPTNPPPPPPGSNEGCTQDEYPRCQDGECDRPDRCCKKDFVNKTCKCLRCNY